MLFYKIIIKNQIVINVIRENNLTMFANQNRYALNCAELFPVALALGICQANNNFKKLFYSLYRRLVEATRSGNGITPLLPLPNAEISDQPGIGYLK